MTEHDQHLGVLMMQCATATPFGRLSGAEQLTVFRWLIDNGHIERTGKPLVAPRPAPIVKARTIEGQPIYADDADHSATETVTMR